MGHCKVRAACHHLPNDPDFVMGRRKLLGELFKVSKKAIEMLTESLSFWMVLGWAKLMTWLSMVML